MRRPLSVLLAAAVCSLALAGLLSPSARPVAATATPAPGPVCVASREEPLLGCGEIRCASDADCPTTCGGCITWSGTCALFQPR